MYCEEFDVEKSKEYEHYLMSKYNTIRKFVIGKTVLSRDITAYTIGKTGGVLLCGTFHSMERITGLMLYRFLDDVCEKMKNDEDFAKAVNKTGLTIVPIVNPDGVQISVHGTSTAGFLAEKVSERLLVSELTHTFWQANARGVDINHNFDAGFEQVKSNERKMGIVSPSPTRYGGEYPESENETKALCDLCRSYSYSLAVALHSQGREIYYDFSDNTPKESFGIASTMSKLSGYKVACPLGIAVGGGFKDWFIEYFRRPAFTIEVGKGKNPLPLSTVKKEYPKVSKMLWYLLDYGINNR